jgi:hypothetical protein
MKSKVLIMITLLTVILSDCGDGRPIQDEQDPYSTYFVRISRESGGDIVYDSRTGVQYWRSDGSYNYGTLTVLIDADGKPLIYKGE